MKIYPTIFQTFFGLVFFKDDEIAKSSLMATSINYIGRKLFDVELYLFNKDNLITSFEQFVKTEYTLEQFTYYSIEKRTYSALYYKKNRAFFYNSIMDIHNYFYNMPKKRINTKAVINLTFFLS